MPNTLSTKKALRQSKAKREHNLFWKKRIRNIVKSIKNNLSESDSDIAIIKEQETQLYKLVDKAAKNQVIHKNKAKRIKSKVSKNIAAHEKSNKPKKEKKVANNRGSKSVSKLQS